MIENSVTKNQLNKEFKDFEFIPSDLKTYDQWVVWKSEIRDGKPTKVPFDANTRGYASTNNPKTWATYDQAVRVYTRCKGYNGIGFVFSTDDPFMGLDWDDVRDPSTGISDSTILSEEILPLGSYAEISPSGTGVHVIAIGSVPWDCNKSGNREMYDSGRYFTMTGMHIEGTPLTVENPSQDALERVYQRMVSTRKPQKVNVSSVAGCKTSLKMGDEQVIAQCLLARNSNKFRAFYENGNISGYGSHSEADMALCGILEFFTQDPMQIDRIFRQSALYRPKWDEKRGSTTYGARTIDEVLKRSSGYEKYRTKSLTCQKWRISTRKPFNKDMEEDLWEM